MRAGYLLLLSLGLPALAQADAPASSPNTETIVVQAKRLNAARAGIRADLGATVYRFSPVALRNVPQGEDAALNQVLLRAPGVAEDSFGQIHVRGDHNEVQYRLNGIELPEGIAGFGQALESRFAHSLSLITGALPAQYGFLPAGVIDITTKTGATDPGGEISVTGGSRDYLQPSFSYGGTSGPWDFFVTGDFLHTRVGIENPTSSFTAIHDLSNQTHGLAELAYIPDSETRVSLIAGLSHGEFQIPNNPGQVPSLGLTVNGISTFDSRNLDEHQREVTEFAILTLQKHFADFDVEVSGFSRYSSLYFSPSFPGDLLFTGIAQRAGKSVWSSGAQADASWYVAPDHTLRAGLYVTGERLVSRTTAQVLAIAPDGGELSDMPVSLQDNGALTGLLFGMYVQDEWRITPTLTLNAGARFDAVQEFARGNQISPRANLVWRATPELTLHAGYARYFTPPPFEEIATTDIARFAGTSAAPAVTLDDPVKIERDNYYDAGADWRPAQLPGVRLGIDGYFKTARNLIDEGQFGAPIILTAFNYDRGQVGGVELSASYDRGPWSLYANLANSRAIGHTIVSSQFNFGPDELAYIARHWIHLDHDERWAGSGGVAYAAFGGTMHPARFSADLVVGSGLRASAGGIPNGAALPGYYVINLSSDLSPDKARLPGLSFRVDALNLLDRRYIIRNGTGVGVGAPQYGLRRTLLATVAQHF